MRNDYESTDEASAAKLAADEAIPDPPPDPSEYEEFDVYEHTTVRGDRVPIVALKQPCRVCGENLTRYGTACERCLASMEYDRLERESNR